MSKRLFKQTDWDSNEESIIELSDSEITRYYNSYGFYYSTYEVSLSDLEEQDGKYIVNQHDQSNYDSHAIEAFLKKFEGQYELVEETDDDYAMLVLNNKETAELFCFYANMQEETGDDTETSDKEVYVLEENEFTKQWLSDATSETGEVHEYWDGHNWKKVFLTSNYWETQYKEVTDEYPDWEDKIYVGSTDWNGGRRAVYYALPINDEDKKENYSLLIENQTQWQGESSDYYLSTVSEEAWVTGIFNYVSKDDIENYFQADVDQFIKNYHNELKTGENLSIDDDRLMFSYRDEEYHFNTDEVNDLSRSIEVAREAIKERRLERINDRLAENDYKGVLSLPLQKIFVERQDSLNAGNCIPLTDDLIEKIMQAEGITGSFALRADKLFDYRNDNYSRRAILRSYRQHYLA